MKFLSIILSVLFPVFGLGQFINTYPIDQAYSFTPYLDTLYEGASSFEPQCQSYNVSFEQNGPFSFPTGLELKIEITSTSSTTQFPILWPDSSIVEEGDKKLLEGSLVFSNFADQFIQFSITLEGTPTIPFQPYPCDFEGLYFIGSCLGTYLRFSPDQDTCFVDGINSSVPDPNKHPQLAAYPNPGKEWVTFSYAASSIEEVYSTSSSGKISNLKFVGNQVNVANLPAGNYVITLQTDRWIYHTRFIKE